VETNPTPPPTLKVAGGWAKLLGPPNFLPGFSDIFVPTSPANLKIGRKYLKLKKIITFCKLLGADGLITHSRPA
jgi:hypothetical protein